MSTKEVAQTIREAYLAVYALCECSTEADRLLARALRAATLEERGHRAMGHRWTAGKARYKLPVTTAAEYFAVKWVLANETRSLPKGWFEAATTREDALCGQALREYLSQHDLLRERFERVYAQHSGPISSIDYAEDIANG